MLSPCLLLPILFTTVRAFSPSRHSVDLPENPSCGQLRDLWEEIKQMVAAEQITNEIPLMPLQVHTAIDRILKAASRKGLRGKPSRKFLKGVSSNLVNNKYPLSKDSLIVPLPSSQNAYYLDSSFYSKPPTSSNEGINGVFGEFHEQLPDHKAKSESQPAIPKVLRPSSAVPLGDKKNSETEFYVPRWGLPEDVDSFGSFVDFDIGPQQFTMTRTPKGVSGKWSEISNDMSRQDVSQTCDALVNSDCRINEECACRGRKRLICLHGKCLNRDHDNDTGGSYGIWHDRPIPQSELQLLSSNIRKRSYRSIFM